MILEQRIQRFRDLGDHYHLVGGRVMRLVPADSPYDAPHNDADEDIPF